MYGFKVNHPWVFLIIMPLMDLIFVYWLEIFSATIWDRALPFLVSLWFCSVLFPDMRSYPSTKPK